MTDLDENLERSASKLYINLLESLTNSYDQSKIGVIHYQHHAFITFLVNLAAFVFTNRKSNLRIHRIWPPHFHIMPDSI